ncbi:MAG: hypothetical protein WC612_03340 [Bdellovibrionales bacterium]|jgi:hypothetical protein
MESLSIQNTFVIPLKSGIQRAASAAHKSHTPRRRAALDSGLRQNDTKGRSRT